MASSGKVLSTFLVSKPDKTTQADDSTRLVMIAILTAVLPC